MGKDEAAEGCSNGVVVDVVVNNNDDNNGMLITQDDPLSSAVRPQAPAGDNNSDDNGYAGQAASTGAGPSGKEAEDSEQEEGENSESKHKQAHLLPCRICLGVDLEGCEPASLMPHNVIQSLQEEGLNLRHFMACGPHCAKPAGECATSPTQLRCSCRGGMAVAHYVCMLGWLAKRKTHKCEICGQIVASIRAADIVLFAGEANHLVDINNNATAAGANNNNAQSNPPSTSQCLITFGILAFLVIVWEVGLFTAAGGIFMCWSSLHEPKKAIIVAASLLGLHNISLPCIILIASKAKCLRCDTSNVGVTWCFTPLCLVLLLFFLSFSGKYCHDKTSPSPSSHKEAFIWHGIP